jgi:hypothetical protein
VTRTDKGGPEVETLADVAEADAEHDALIVGDAVLAPGALALGAVFVGVMRRRFRT